MSEFISQITTDSHWLYQLGPEYISWSTTDSTICLDGDFTAQQLEDIATHMKKYKGKQNHE